MHDPLETRWIGRLNDLVSDAFVLHGSKPGGDVPAEEHPPFVLGLILIFKIGHC